ncbi:2'-5' RNA ligase family protein [Salinibacterium sp. ZJ454]|uniref:2'-5' RNA ligase family protein n=1 Tax=Salinibacterium sp. ZJ454 TaxID=2708339 RepID=UPI00142193A2|nr:2'-5' RNA ligase family protein [Salinibacterium sp. ZJ454]
MSRLVVVLPLSPLIAGERFAVRDWPLHVTVLAPFLTYAEPADIAATITAATSRQSPLTVVAGHHDLFGRRRTVPVTVLVENPELTALHGTLVDAVRPFAAVPNQTAFTGGRFRAHVTEKHHGRVHEGDRLRLTQIALVDMAPAESPGGRAVLATIALGRHAKSGTATS